MTIRYAFADNTLILTQTASTDKKYATASNFLNLQQSATTNFKVAKARNVISFSQHAGRAASSFNRGVVQFLQLQQSAKRVIDAQAANSLVFTQSTITTYDTSNQLLLVQSAVAFVAKAARNTLIINQSVHLNRTINRECQQTLTLNQYASASTQNLCDDPSFNDDAQNVTFSLNSLSVVLPAPDFNNTESLDYQINVNETKGGYEIPFRHTEWPKTVVLEYSWDSLKFEQVENLREFMKITVGQIITIDDYEGNNWQGIIVTPEADVSETGINKFQISISIELTTF